MTAPPPSRLQQLLSAHGDREVHWGVLNPPGEPDDRQTTYWSQSQLERVVPHLQGLPVHISHMTETEAGAPIDACGAVFCSAIHPTTGALYVGVVLNDSVNGKIAQAFRGDKSLADVPETHHLGEFSLGYGVAFTGDKEVWGNQATEVSLCFKGARENTVIKGKTTIRSLVDGGNLQVFIPGEHDLPAKHNEAKDPTSPKSQSKPNPRIEIHNINQIMSSAASSSESTQVSANQMLAPVGAMPHNIGVQIPSDAIQIGDSMPAMSMLRVGASANTQQQQRVAQPQAAPVIPKQAPTTAMDVEDPSSATDKQAVDDAAAKSLNVLLEAVGLLEKAEKEAREPPQETQAQKAAQEASGQDVVFPDPALDPTIFGGSGLFNQNPVYQAPIPTQANAKDIEFITPAEDASPETRQQIKMYNMKLENVQKRLLAFEKAQKEAAYAQAAKNKQVLGSKILPVLHQQFAKNKEAVGSLNDMARGAVNDPNSATNKNFMQIVSAAASAMTDLLAKNTQNAAEVEKAFQERQLVKKAAKALMEQNENLQEQLNRRPRFSSPEDRAAPQQQQQQQQQQQASPGYSPNGFVLPVGASMGSGMDTSNGGFDFEALDDNTKRIMSMEYSASLSQGVPPSVALWQAQIQTELAKEHETDMAFHRDMTPEQLMRWRGGELNPLSGPSQGSHNAWGSSSAGGW